MKLDNGKRFARVNVVLRPEAILGLLISLKLAERCNFPIRNAPHVYFFKYRGATVAFRLHSHQRHHHIFFGEDVMNFDRENTAAKRQGVFEESDDLIAASVIAGDWALPGNVPGNRRSECLNYQRDIALREIFVYLTDNRSAR